MDGMEQDTKKALRREAKIMRAAIPAGVRSDKSSKIHNALFALPDFQTAANVFCFVSFQAEVETRPILKHLWAQGKRVYIPYIHEKHSVMRASQLNSLDELEVGFFNVMEQKDAFVRVTPPGDIDLVITPGLLFDREGYRVGYGGRYYDGFFASFQNPVRKIGICFEEQMRTALPRYNHDIPVDWIVTDERIYQPAASRKWPSRQHD